MSKSEFEHLHRGVIHGYCGSDVGLTENVVVAVGYRGGFRHPRGSMPLSEKKKDQSEMLT